MSTTAALDPGTARYAAKYVAAYEATVRHLAALRAAGLPTAGAAREMVIAMAGPEPRDRGEQMVWFDRATPVLNGVYDAFKGRPAAWEAIEAEGEQEGGNGDG